MIQVNLLPDQIRKQKKLYLDFAFDLGKIKFVAGGVALGILIFLFLIFSVGSAVRKSQILNLLKEEGVLSSQKTQIESTADELKMLRFEKNTMETLIKRKFLWAKKLSELSDLVLPGIWFTRVRTDGEDKLIIEGSVISKGEEAMALVGKFMKNIREHESFFKDFGNIKLESVQRKNIAERDVVDFTIALYFEEGHGS